MLFTSLGHPCPCQLPSVPTTNANHGIPNAHFHAIIWLVLIAYVTPILGGSFLYDSGGQYEGMVNDEGWIYDDRYQLQGRIDDKENVYGDNYRYWGRIVADGEIEGTLKSIHDILSED